MQAEYVKNIEGLATAVSEHPFGMTAAAEYLRKWCRGAATLSPLLDTSIFRSGPVSGLDAMGRHHGAALRARALQPDPANVRVIVARQRQVAARSGRRSFLNLMACDLHRQGSTWRQAYQVAERMWGRLGAGLTSALQRSFEEVPDAGLLRCGRVLPRKCFAGRGGRG